MLAEYFGCDYADLADTRYQPTRFVRVPVWTSGNDYYCVTREGEAPPARWDAVDPGGGTGLAWENQGDVYPLNTPKFAGTGLSIWRAKCGEWAP